MRIVTLNTWKNEGDYPRRLNLMAGALGALSADVVCLQECFAGGGDDTAARLAEALGLIAHVRPARAKPRQHGGEAVVSTSGLAVLCRAPARDEAVLSLPSDPRDGDRIAQRLDLEMGGAPLRILNLHLTHLHGPGSCELRARQLEAALRWAADRPETGLVVAGDLNAPAAAPELGALAGAADFAATTFLGGRSGGAPSERPAIDHLVLQTPGRWRVKARFRALDQADAEGFFPSDHAAVVVDLDLELRQGF